MQILGFLPPRKSSYTPLGPKIALFVRPHRELHDAKNRKLLPLRIRVLHTHENTIIYNILREFADTLHVTRVLSLVLVADADICLGP